MSMSEVARLKEQIACEYEAVQAGMNGYAIVSKHDFIQRKYQTIGIYYEQLSQQVGAQEAMRMICEIIEGKQG